jgi:AraC family transcriptional regulator of adaptative response/methylated-DNA-[protein]-cysteine methyltransferase
MHPATVSDGDWQAVLRRRSADRPFVYAVTTTGVYCRPGCPSRAPRRENVRVFADGAAAERAGFRPCRRCGGEAAAAETGLLERARAVIDAAEAAPSLAALAQELGTSPRVLQRLFRNRLGVTPKAFIQARRRERLRAALEAEPRVTDAIYAAGYNASSRFYSEAGSVLGMTPGDYRAKGRGLALRWSTAACPLGRVLVAATDRGVAMIAFGDDDASLEAVLDARFAAADRQRDATGLGPLVAQVVGALEEPDAAAEIPLDIRGTAFQQRVWAALRAIPRGETRSYGEIARAIGRPQAVRAVANACAGNPVALAVPCHRVLPSGGDIGGYRWGAARKAWLLDKEQGERNRACLPGQPERS